MTFCLICLVSLSTFGAWCLIKFKVIFVQGRKKKVHRLSNTTVHDLFTQELNGTLNREGKIHRAAVLTRTAMFWPLAFLWIKQHSDYDVYMSRIEDISFAFSFMCDRASSDLWLMLTLRPLVHRYNVCTCFKPCITELYSGFSLPPNSGLFLCLCWLCWNLEPACKQQCVSALVGSNSSIRAYTCVHDATKISVFYAA